MAERARQTRDPLHRSVRMRHFLRYTTTKRNEVLFCETCYIFICETCFYEQWSHVGQIFMRGWSVVVTRLTCTMKTNYGWYLQFVQLENCNIEDAILSANICKSCILIFVSNNFCSEKNAALSPYFLPQFGMLKQRACLAGTCVSLTFLWAFLPGMLSGATVKHSGKGPSLWKLTARSGVWSALCPQGADHTPRMFFQLLN